MKNIKPIRGRRLTGLSAAAPLRPANPCLLSLDGGVADDWLGGGLRADGLHEGYAATAQDIGSMLGFLLLLGQIARRGSDDAAILWLRDQGAARIAGQAYGPGLVELGIAPDTLTLVALPDARALLRAGLDSVRAGGAAAVLLELHGRQPLLDLTASRRLALAAAETGTMVLIARGMGEQVASAAHTRWQVASAPSSRLLASRLRTSPSSTAAPGAPAFALTLLRQRGGRDGLNIMLEWNRDTARFAERPVVETLYTAAPLSGAPLATSGGRARDQERHRAA
ncbi:MAG: hypothetical protein U5J78_05715 [Parasphingorhabdus sp.]|nr:hypothetical protein [Parasphingorhabdus sp.]